MSTTTPLSKLAGEARSTWVPQRQDIIWIDCNPQTGREMRDRHPFLVLSPQPFNARTSLVIGLPMSIADYNADNPFAVVAGQVKLRTTVKTSFVLCHQPKSFDWRQRAAAPHPMKRMTDLSFIEVCARLNQIVQIA